MPALDSGCTHLHGEGAEREGGEHSKPPSIDPLEKSSIRKRSLQNITDYTTFRAGRCRIIQTPHPPPPTLAPPPPPRASVSSRGRAKWRIVHTRAIHKSALYYCPYVYGARACGQTVHNCMARVRVGLSAPHRRRARHAMPVTPRPRRAQAPTRPSRDARHTQAPTRPGPDAPVTRCPSHPGPDAPRPRRDRGEIRAPSGRGGGSKRVRRVSRITR